VRSKSRASCAGDSPAAKRSARAARSSSLQRVPAFFGKPRCRLPAWRSAAVRPRPVRPGCRSTYQAIELKFDQIIRKAHRFDITSQKQSTFIKDIESAARIHSRIGQVESGSEAEDRLPIR